MKIWRILFLSLKQYPPNLESLRTERRTMLGLARLLMLEKNLLVHASTVAFFQTKLTRHIKTVHKNEEKVKKILGLDRKQQEKEFDLLRKQGIYEHNLKLMKKGKTQVVLEVERKQIKKEGKESKLKVCTLCKAFVKSTYYTQHVKACFVFKDESQSKNQIVSGLSADLLQKYEDTKDKEFVDILNRFATDEIGTFCKNDKMLLTFGAFMFKKKSQA